jgi:formylglycine-generating enzyme required for sulfatase activity
MALTSQQRMAMIDFLVPLLNDQDKRKAYFELLFVDPAKRPDVDLHGSPRIVTMRIVAELERYSIAPAKPALVDFLDLIGRWDVGVDQQAQIQEWQKALLTHASPPAPIDKPSKTPIAPASQSPVLNVPNQPFQTQSPALPLSRAESFSIPAPFEWITIPAGKVTLEGKNESYLKAETTFDVSAFGIGKYPITLAQYVKFVEAGGYETRAWWTRKGWRGLSQDRAKMRERRDSLITVSEMRANHPAPVTWYEALAFCAWLHSVTDEPVTLPTEQQWQRAAQGDDHRLFPWGIDWDAARCNNQNSHLTSVYKYEDSGRSPYGVVDMVGNAAEWTVTNWLTGEQGGDGEEARVVRGGAYTNKHLSFYRVTTRHKEWPTTLCGFRIVRLLE